MKKRAICFLLSAVILLSLVSVCAGNVYAASDMKASEDCIAFIKQIEGFAAKPYKDVSQWTVGYGTSCSAGEYANGITEAEADALLRKALAEFEEDVNNFADKYKLSLKQQQFDALVSFTYNLGPNWMNNDSVFRSAVVSGATGNDFIFAITRWCTAGSGDEKTIVSGLVDRRLSEANMYLNGVYSKSVPSNYDYVVFNNNMEDCVNLVRIQGYDSSITDGIRATPTKSGYRFLGWYTAATGGEWITNLDASTAGITLYGHWQNGEGELDADGNIAGTAANYQRYASSTTEQVVRDTPSLSGSEVKKLEPGQKVTITADYVDSGNTKWGKLEGGGWINLGESTTELDSSANAVSVDVTVTSDGVNIRSGPGTNYTKLGTAYNGQQITITQVQEGGLYQWGKFSAGWICLDYTDYDTVTAENSEDATKVTAIGTVINTDKLNVRSGPGTSYPIVGSLSGGEQVKITLQKKVGTNTWGLTEKGWVTFFYLQVTEVAEGEVPDIELPDTSGSETTTPDTGDSGTAATPDTTETVTGTVYNCNTLRIRSGAGTSYAHIGNLTSGTQVVIYEQTTVNGQTWGRIDQGWICLTYVKLGTTGTTSSTISGTVYNCTTLRIRAGAGTNYAKVGTLAQGTKVEILEQTKVNGTTWGRIDQGWISLYYVKLDSDSSTGSTGTTSSGTASSGSTSSGGTSTSGTVTGTVVNTDTLRIRSGPGVNNTHVGDLTRGTKVEILEQTVVNRTTWGRIKQGWISLYYVDLDVQAADGATVKTVTTTLRIRSGAGTSNAHIGNYYSGNQVVILEQTTVNGRPWGRTDKGWICLEYVA